MRKEIVLPAHLYDRVKASAGEHGGIGAGRYFDETTGFPLCVHGHAWGTEGRMRARRDRYSFDEPELEQYITSARSDHAVMMFHNFLLGRKRMPFWLWSVALNVKRAPDTPAPEKQSQEVETVNA